MRPEKFSSVELDTRRESCTRSYSVTSAHPSTEVFDLSRHIPDDSEDMSHLAEAFNSRLRATEQLVSAFISMCGKGTSGFQQEDLLLKYHAAQSEVRPTSPILVNQHLVYSCPGKESPLPISHIAIPASGNDGTKGTIPQ